MLVVAPLLPRLMGRLGTLPALYLGIAVAVAALLMMALLPSLGAWFVLRFVLGLGNAIHCVVSETWINAVPTAAPSALMAVALLIGFTHIVVLTLLPVYGVRLGLGQDTAVLMLSVFLAGSVVLQLPIGWLAGGRAAAWRSRARSCGRSCSSGAAPSWASTPSA